MDTKNVKLSKANKKSAKKVSKNQAEAIKITARENILKLNPLLAGKSDTFLDWILNAGFNQTFIKGINQSWIDNTIHALFPEASKLAQRNEVKTRAEEISKSNDLIKTEILKRHDGFKKLVLSELSYIWNDLNTNHYDYDGISVLNKTYRPLQFNVIDPNGIKEEITVLVKIGDPDENVDAIQFINEKGGPKKPADLK